MLTTKGIAIGTVKAFKNCVYKESLVNSICINNNNNDNEDILYKKTHWYQPKC